MSSIQSYLSQILSAVYGRDVRQSIHDAIKQCYDDVSNPDLNTDAFKTALAAAIEDGTLTALNVGDNTIRTEKLADGAVTRDKISNNSVTTVKIVDSAVSTAKLMDAAVTNAKLADGAVSYEKLGEDIVDIFNHFTKDIETLQASFKSINNNVSLVIEASKTYANGHIWGDDGLLYLTHNGEIVSAGLQVASGSGGGLSFNSGYQDEEGKIHLTLDGEDIEGFDPFVIAGGSGGAAGSKLVFAMYSASAFSVLQTTKSAPVKFRFSSVDAETGSQTGAGNLAIYVGGILKDSRTIEQGDNIMLDVFSYLATGSNTVKLVMTDSYGTVATRTLTITVETFILEWNLGNTEKNTGNLLVYVTPTGSGSKVIHLLLDGVEYETRTVTTSGRRIEFDIPLSIGAHTISVYGTMTLSGVTLTSETLTSEIAQVQEGDSRVVIAANLVNAEFDQYATINIPYRVIDPSNNPSSVSFYANDELITTEQVDQSEHIWAYRATEAGSLKLGISCRTGSWSKTVTINALSSEIGEVTDNLALKVDPNVISDLDAFNYNGATIKVSDNFDSHNGGLGIDENGVRCIKVMKGDRLTVNYNLFGTDARVNGRNIKFVYKIDNASEFNSSAISCKNGNIGLTITANNAVMQTEQTKLELPTCEGYKTELELNIEADSENRLMMFWEKGTPSKAVVYATNDNFKQTSPVGITVGSDTCDITLYLIRVYTRDLTKDESKSNFCFDGGSALDITNRFDRNQVYDSSGKLDPDKVAVLNPNLHVLTWHASGISTAKSQIVNGQLTHRYVSGGAEHSWTADEVEQKAQGTSSLGYVQAGCNEDFRLSKGITLEDGTHLDTYAMSDNSIGVDYFNFKTNVASQEHINNILLSDWYNKYQPFIRPARAANAKVRDTVEGHLAVMFFHNTGESAITLGGISVQPDETVLYSLGCLNNSKKNADVFAYDDIVIEVNNNISDQCRFKSDDLSAETWGDDANFQFRYLNEQKYSKGEAAALFQKFISWVVACDISAATNQAFGTVKTINGQTFQTDSAEYRTAKFKSEASNYMAIDSFLYHKLFTWVFSEVDNRAKNVFLGYDSSTGLWNVVYSYDNDTAMGNDNEGGLTLKYGYMDTDTVGTKNVFNAADSSLWSSFDAAFADELRDMYIDRANKGAWDLDTFATLCDTVQDYACESIWIEDIWRKDINTLIYCNTSMYIPMLNGKKTLQRRNFLHYQRPFVDSYYVGSYVTSDTATIRGYTPSEWSGIKPESKMTVTPYSDLWVTVKAGSVTVQKRAKAGEAVELNLGNSSMNDTEIYVRAAGFISDLGDLSCLYPGLTDLSPCKRLRRAVIGSSESGYCNTNMKEVSVTNAASLELINVEGCPELVQELNLSNNVAIKECYTRGSGITGVTFANWGRLETALLNGVTSIYANNLRAVKTFSLESYNALTTLNIVSGVIDALQIATKAANLTRVRLKDMAWNVTISTYKTLLKLYNADGIDDDGHNTDHGIITGACHFDAIGETKYNTLVSLLTDLVITYDTLLEEHTVTFQNEDGTELYVAKTEHNGAVEDPIVEGYIETPTKAPDTDYVYTFYKWDISLENISTDAIATATYTRAQRSNTVQFCNDDGSVLETYIVEAHGKCAYSGADLTKSGYIWIGWDKQTNDVIEDMIVTAVYIYPTLPASVKDMSLYDYAYSDDPDDKSAYTFAEFYAIQKMGRTADYLPVGCQIKMVPNWSVTSDTSIIFQRHSIGHYKLVTGGMSHADWYMKGILTANRQMNTSNTNVGGWDSTALRKWLNGTFYKGLQPQWRNLIAEAITLANAGNQTSDITESNDFLRIPSRAEVGFNVNDVPYTNEVASEAAEKTFSLYTDNNSRIKKTFNGEGEARWWWLRSADAGSSTSFAAVYYYGYSNPNNASYSYGVCVGFSV